MKKFTNYELYNGQSITVFEIDNNKSLALGVNVALSEPETLTTGIATLSLPFEKTYEFANGILSYSATITGKPSIPTVRMTDNQDYYATRITKNLPSTTKDRKAVIQLLNKSFKKYGLSVKDYGIK